MNVGDKVEGLDRVEARERERMEVDSCREDKRRAKEGKEDEAVRVRWKDRRRPLEIAARGTIVALGQIINPEVLTFFAS